MYNNVNCIYLHIFFKLKHYTNKFLQILGVSIPLCLPLPVILYIRRVSKDERRLEFRIRADTNTRIFTAGCELRAYNE